MELIRSILLRNNKKRLREYIISIILFLVNICEKARKKEKVSRDRLSGDHLRLFKGLTCILEK